MNNLPDSGSTYADYISFIKESLKQDLTAAYPALKDTHFGSLSELPSATDDTFIFIIDEWDYIFSHDLYADNQSDFLEFLRDLLKDRPYVALAYMTGVLPLKKYGTGSALNMFKEYTMLNDPLFETYFGFTEAEVEMLCRRQTLLSLNEISEWYNGYQTKNGSRIYNPRSVVCALEDGTCQSYWTSACLKNHSCQLHAPLCGIFGPHSVNVARYASLIRVKSPTNCDAHLTESIFQTRSRYSRYNRNQKRI